LMVAYDGACSPNVSARMAWISNDTIDSILWHQEVGQAKDLSAPLYIQKIDYLSTTGHLWVTTNPTTAFNADFVR
jgi:hypothetical protein